MKQNLGFTLIEVILSVMVFSIGLTAVYRPLISSLDAIDYAESRLEMNRLVSNQIWEWEQVVKQSGYPLTNNKGILLGGKKAFHYFADIRTIGLEPLLQQVKIKVEWTGLGRKQQTSREIYVLSHASSEQK